MAKTEAQYDPASDEDNERRVLTTEVPKASPGVTYVMDRVSMEAAIRANRLNQMGSIGIMELRAKHDELRAKVSKDQLELAMFVDQNPWFVTTLPDERPAHWGRALGTIAVVGGALALLIYAATHRPTLPAKASAQDRPGDVSEATSRGRVGRPTPPDPPSP
jgi:hypothetical protein